MNYAELRSAINKEKQAINSLRGTEMRLKKELGDIGVEKQGAKQTYQSSYSEEKQKAQSAYKSQMLKPLEEKRAQVEADIAALRKKHEEDLLGLTEDNLMSQCSDRQDILREVRESSEQLHSVIVEVIGERFCEELESQLSVQEIQLDEERLKEIVAYFNICSKDIAKVSKKGSIFMGMVDKMQALLTGTAFSKGTEGNQATGIAIALLALVAICYRYVFPYYLVLLVVAGGFELYRNYKVLKVILAQKTIRDNVDAIASMLHRQVLDELEKRTLAVNSEFEENLKEKEHALSDLNTRITSKAKEAETSFVFDESKIRQVLTAVLQQKENRENEINSSLHKTEIELAAAYKRLDALQEELGKTVGNIQYEFLNFDKVGTSYELDGTFIVDVEKSKPVFFKHPMKSALFLYSEEEEVAKFVRLLLFQLRVKLNPNSFSVDIFDPTTLGSSYLCFKPVPKDDKEAGVLGKLFEIITSEDEYKKRMDDYSKEIAKRFNLIMTGYEGIVAYNRFMLANESLPEAMKFVFVQNPNPRIFENPLMKQQLRNGGKVGMYFHVFMPMGAFYKMGDKVQEVLENTGCFYYIENSKVLPRAREFIYDQMVQIAERKRGGGQVFP